MIYNDIIIAREDAFDFQSAEYQALYAACDATVFQSPFWLDAFYRVLAPALAARAVIVSIRESKSQALLMVLPFVCQSKFGVQILQPADLGISDYNSLIGQRATLNHFAQLACFNQKLKAALSPFDVLLFRKQRPDGFCLAHLLQGTEVQPNINAAYELTIENDFSTWQRERLSKATRKGLARKRRSFESTIAPLHYRFVREPEEMIAAMAFLRRERAKRYPGDLLGNPAYFDFYCDIAINQANEGKAVLYVGAIGDEIVTVDFGLYEKERYLMLLGAFSSEPHYQKYSLGLLGIIDLMQAMHKKGAKVYDFSIGDEAYKQSFRAQRIALSNIMLSNSFKGRAALAAYQKAPAIKKLIKQIAPNIR